MERNDKIREQIFEIIDNQLKENNPPETKMTYERLIKQGYDDLQVRQLIGQCLSVELFRTIKYREPYDRNIYLSNLQNLPKEPFEK